MDFNETYRQRTKKLTIDVAKWYHALSKKDEVVRVFGRQLIRCTSSTAANFRAANRARSEAERYAKMCIVVEENDETLFWMECFEELDWVDTRNLKIYYKEAFEILKVMASTKKKLGENK
jgi:four helix bundle protein